MPAPPLPSRRAVVRLGLVAAAGVAVGGCTRGSDGSTEPTAPGGPEDPDRGLRAEVGAEETALSVLYAAAAPRLPADERTRVTTLGSRHEAYRQAIDPDGLATRPPSDAASTTGPSTSASASRSSTPAPQLPSAPAEVVAALRTAERDAATTRLAQSLRAVDAELARLLVLAGAGAAGAAQVLAGGAT